MLDDNPLKYKPRKKKQSVSAASAPASGSVPPNTTDTPVAVDSPTVKRKFSLSRRKSTQKAAGGASTSTASPNVAPPVPALPKEGWVGSGGNVAAAAASSEAKHSGVDLLKQEEAAVAGRKKNGSKNRSKNSKNSKQKSNHSIDQSGHNLNKMPGDNDPYLTSLQKGEHPHQKGKKINQKERYELELEYIENNFRVFDHTKRSGNNNSNGLESSTNSLPQMKKDSSRELMTQDRDLATQDYYFTAAGYNADFSPAGTSTGEYPSTTNVKNNFSNMGSVISNSDIPGQPDRRSIASNAGDQSNDALAKSGAAGRRASNLKSVAEGASKESLNDSMKKNFALGLLKRSESKNRVSESSSQSGGGGPLKKSDSKNRIAESPLLSPSAASPSSLDRPATSPRGSSAFNSSPLKVNLSPKPSPTTTPKDGNSPMGSPMTRNNRKQQAQIKS